MNSIVLNPKVAACDVFYAFSSFLEFYGDQTGDRYTVCPCIGTDVFYWEVCRYVEVPEGWRGLGIGDKVFTYKFTRDQQELYSARLSDHSVFFINEYRKFMDLFLGNEEKLIKLFPKKDQIVGLFYDEIIGALGLKKPLVEESIFNHGGWHTADEIPDADPGEENLTYYVLIDLDGKREDFKVGYYNTGSEKWFLAGISTREDIDLDHMRWTNLPLASRDKK